jgi:integrase
MNYWHIMARKYMPIKKEIIKESNYIINKIFKGRKNILGILLRGTDYIARKPRNHPIPPNTKDAIKDVKLLDNKYKYDWIFLATEDNIIRRDFLSAMGTKVKCLINNIT